MGLLLSCVRYDSALKKDIEIIKKPIIGCLIYYLLYIYNIVMSICVSFINEIKKIILKTKKLKRLYSVKHPNTKYKLDDIINDIIYVLKTGISWRSIRTPINFRTLYFHFKRFVKHDIFGRLFKKIRNNHINNNNNISDTYIIDSSFIMNICGKNKISRNKFFKNKNCNKISLITDDNGIPLSVLVNKGTVHDVTFINKHYNDLIILSKKNNIKKYLLADKAYESKKYRIKLLKYNYNLMVPKKKGAISNYYFNKLLYKKRIKVEHTFQKIKTYRRIRNRYDKLFRVYKQFVLMGSSLLIYKWFILKG